MMKEKLYDVIVIGGGPAGLTAALYLARAGCRTLVLEKRGYGGQIAITNEVVNYPGVPKTSGMELTDTMRRQAEDFGAEFLIAEARELSLFDAEKTVKTSAGNFRCIGVLLATGAQPKMAGFRGEEEFRGRGVSYCATCDGAFFRGKDVAIVGGGNTALEDALYLANVCRTVYLVHRRDAFRGEKALADRVRQKENIKIQYDSAVSKIRGESAVSSVLLENTKTGAQQELPVSAVFVAIGLIPENEIFSRQLPLDDNGYFVAGEDCKTPLEGVFVAGDCRSKLLRQIITAAADGAVAGYQAAAYVNGI